MIVGFRKVPVPDAECVTCHLHISQACVWCQSMVSGMFQKKDDVENAKYIWFSRHLSDFAIFPDEVVRIILNFVCTFDPIPMHCPVEVVNHGDYAHRHCAERSFERLFDENRVLLPSNTSVVQCIFKG
jgi:hypothetical protein